MAKTPPPILPHFNNFLMEGDQPRDVSFLIGWFGPEQNGHYHLYPSLTSTRTFYVIHKDDILHWLALDTGNQHSPILVFLEPNKTAQRVQIGSTSPAQSPIDYIKGPITAAHLRRAAPSPVHGMDLEGYLWCSSIGERPCTF